VNATANTIANALAQLGVERGEKVSTMIDNQLHATLSMFGIQKGGMVYAPINYEFEGETLSYQISDIDPGVLLIEDQFNGKLNDIKGAFDELPRVVIIETDEETEPLDEAFETSGFQSLLDAPEAEPVVSPSWHDDAAIIYTSGTTGHPKGVLVPYRWIAYYSAVRWQVMSRDDVVHTSLPLYHGAGPFWDIAAALITGAEVALWDQYSPSRFLDRVNEYEATTVTLISVMHTWLHDQPERADDHRNPLNKVQMSPLPEYHEEMAERFSFDFITSKFGQQESGNPLTGFINAARGEHATPEDIRRGFSPAEITTRAEEMGIPVVEEVPEERWIGSEMPWMEVQVVDEHDEALPPGEIGEMAVRPKLPGVTFKHYYNRPEKTVEEFRNLWFHVGDAVYRDEEGNFFFVDRIGHIIRKRGENISPEQIEHIAKGYDPIDEIAVFPIPGEDVEDEIAYVIRPRDGTDLDEDALFEFLDGELADIMLPDRVVFTDDIPVTDTNKIQKNELRDRLFGA
jgi:crotonobetaine/carnitine-CoA ligase